MTTLSSIIFIICIIFTFYKIKKYFCKERNETTNKCIIKRVTLKLMIRLWTINMYINQEWRYIMVNIGIIRNWSWNKNIF